MPDDRNTRDAKDANKTSSTNSNSGGGNSKVGYSDVSSIYSKETPKMKKTPRLAADIPFLI